jgi:pimeloyl-ACP methyl ester carboxylesterase
MAPLPLVLVHGGAHGAWCWEPTVAHLDGPVLAIDLPPKAVRGGDGRHEQLAELQTLTIADFAASAIADIDAAGFDRFVLVGHSMGGLTISEVAARVPDRVARLVYVSCIVPPEGGSAIDALPAELREMTTSAIQEARQGGANPIGNFDEGTATYMFCNDMTDEQQRFVLDRIGTEVVGILAEDVSRKGIPPTLSKTYVKLLQDQSLAPADQDRLIANLRESPGGDVEVVELDSGHDAMVSHPEELAAVLHSLATSSS